MSARILMYHGLASPAFPSELTDPGDLVYVLSSNMFERHLRWLEMHGWSMAIDGRGGSSERHCVLTFDDGHITNYQVALPILERTATKAHFFITSDWIGNSYFMSESMLRELGKSGMVIGSHGATHQFLTDMSPAAARAELETSKKRLEDILGYAVTTLSAPGGRIDYTVGTIAAELGYSDIYTSDATPQFSVDGITIHGRLALKRNYSLEQFEKMMHRGVQPESALRTRGIAIAKRALGNQRYQRLRAAALRVLELRRR